MLVSGKETLSTTSRKSRLLDQMSVKLIYSTSIGPIVSFEMVANDKDADELDPVNTEGSDDEDVPEIPVDGSSQVVVRTVKNRICDKLCYVCKTKVGPDSSKRIGNFANNLFKTFYKCHRNNH